MFKADEALVDEALVAKSQVDDHPFKLAAAQCIHHPNTPSPQLVERERAEERKRIEKDKLAITTRHRVLTQVWARASHRGQGGRANDY